jgi:uncharacterized integral membrane protein
LYNNWLTTCHVIIIFEVFGLHGTTTITLGYFGLFLSTPSKICHLGLTYFYKIYSNWLTTCHVIIIFEVFGLHGTTSITLGYFGMFLSPPSKICHLGLTYFYKIYSNWLTTCHVIIIIQGFWYTCYYYYSGIFWDVSLYSFEDIPRGIMYFYKIYIV